MTDKLIRLASIVFVVFVSQSLASEEDGQMEDVQKKMSGDFFAGHNASLRRLLSFKWSGDKLILRRDWVAPKVEPDPNDRFWEHRVVTPVQHEFNQVTAGLGIHSSGRSGSGDRMRLTRGGTDFFCTAVIRGKDCQFMFDQNNKPNRRFIFEEDEEGKVDILLTYETGLINVVQNKKGDVRISIADDEYVCSYKANSFRELFEKQPEVTEKVFFPLLEYLGVGLPLTESSSEVREFVTHQLLLGLENAESDLRKFVGLLNARRFDDRHRAADLLRANYGKWQSKLKALAKDGDLALESRLRIQSIIDNAEQDRKHTLWEIVSKNRLMNSDDYLFSLAEESNPKLMEAIFKQIRENAKSDSGESAKEKYQNWKSSQNR